MIDDWTMPAYLAIVLGAVLFAAVFVPVLAWESRRQGRILPSRVLGAAMVAVYGLALITYTLVPIPTEEWCAANPRPPRNLEPLSFVHDILRYYRAHGGRRTLTSFVFLQAALNVLLFVPWGAFLRRFFGRGIVFATLSGVLVSGLIELTQTTGAFGLLACRYRVGDVDDVILNGSGALIGAVFAPLLLFFLPDPRGAAERRRAPRPVTRARRLVGMLIDASAVGMVQVTLVLTWRMYDVYVAGNAIADESAWVPFLAGLAAFVLIAVLPALSRAGASLGQRAMWLQPEFPAPPSPGRRLARAMAGLGAWSLLNAVGSVPFEAVASVAGWLASAFATVAVAWVLFDRSARGLSLRATGATLVDAREAG
ncbi:MAG: VanZ family protein [Tessaracoccus sp.]|uniref:VanZ family protein n=1 Tax=Tessaracoccus sp. TaxID=1971211 RepID=UPI001ED2CA58|nr:VanZ family protein [Tessaracoccus sp.]MBK7822290.1 VanZ family protein [Tessaracoccus sp.]